MRSVCPHVRLPWRASGASARVGGGLTVRLRDCYCYVIGECLPCPLGVLLFVGWGPLYSWFAFFADIVLW